MTSFQNKGHTFSFAIDFKYGSRGKLCFAVEARLNGETRT